MYVIKHADGSLFSGYRSRPCGHGLWWNMPTGEAFDAVIYTSEGAARQAISELLESTGYRPEELILTPVTIG